MIDNQPANGAPWMSRRACTDADAELFFVTDLPGRKRPGFVSTVEEPARSLCRGCKVKDECRDYAIANDEHGIWGDTNEDERAALVEGAA